MNVIWTGTSIEETDKSFLPEFHREGRIVRRSDEIAFHGWTAGLFAARQATLLQRRSPRQ